MVTQSWIALEVVGSAYEQYIYTVYVVIIHVFLFFTLRHPQRIEYKYIHIRTDHSIVEHPLNSVVTHFPHALRITKPFGIVASGILVAATESAATTFDFHIRSIYIVRPPHTIRDEVCDFVYASGISVAAKIIIINQ